MASENTSTISPKRTYSAAERHLLLLHSWTKCILLQDRWDSNTNRSSHLKSSTRSPRNEACVHYYVTHNQPFQHAFLIKPKVSRLDFFGVALAIHSHRLALLLHVGNDTPMHILGSELVSQYETSLEIFHKFNCVNNYKQKHQLGLLVSQRKYQCLSYLNSYVCWVTIKFLNN